MITGIVAQETTPLPRGVFAPVRIYDDDDVLFGFVVSSGLDQNLIPGFVADTEIVLGTGVPITLTTGIVDEVDKAIERVFTPLTAIGRLLAPIAYFSADVFFPTDVRIPGFLQPAFFVDADLIFPTPLILDQGMLRADTVVDYELVFSSKLDAAQGVFPQRLLADEIFYAPLLRAGSTAAPFVLSDDVIYNFTTRTSHTAALFVDDGLPLQPPTRFDGQATSGVTLTADQLTVVHNNTASNQGARSTLAKNTGQFYFEVTLGPSSGVVDCSGIMTEESDFFDLANFGSGVLAVYNNVTAFGIGGVVAAGIVVENGSWWVQLAQSRGSGGTLIEGDVIGMAFDLYNRKAWFRLNGGHWNNDQLGTTPTLNQNPTTGDGGVPIPSTGRFAPVVGLGGQAGNAATGHPGDSFTANFGATPYRDPVPTGYANWVVDSPFPPAFNGDSLGNSSIGIPATLDGAIANVTMSGGNLTAAHLTATTDSGAASASFQNYGKYYFEVKVTSTHGASDCLGLMTSTATFNAMISNGTSCAVVNAGGTIRGTASPGSIGSSIVAGDVIGVAVDLVSQTPTSGGLIWFRKNGGAWNGDTTATFDPVTGVGGVALIGHSNSLLWAPAVGFGGAGTTVGDAMTANFGQVAFGTRPPAGFAVWPIAFNNTVQGLAPLLVAVDDVFPVPFIDSALRTLSHPVGYVIDNESVYPTTSFGGNLLLIVNTLVSDIEAIYPGGYLATFDGAASPNVTVSANKLTATLTTAGGNTGARSTSQKNSGKYYYEMRFAQDASNTNNAVGVLQENGTYFDMSNNLQKCTIVVASGTVYSNNTNTGRGLGALVNGDIIGIAIDFDVRRAWFRKGAGLWNGAAGADPVTNNGGVTIASLASFAPAVTFGGGPVTGAALTGNFGQAAYVDPVPTGFGNWSAPTTSQALGVSLVASDDAFFAPRISPAILNAPFMVDTDTVYLLSGTGGSLTLGPTVVFNDTDATYSPGLGFLLAILDGAVTAVTLSSDKLTATHNATTNNAGARSTALKNAGKFYFEVTYGPVHGDSDSCGIILSTGTFANFVSNGTNCVAIYRWNGGIFANNGSSGQSLGACTASDVISVAIDLDARKAWLRKNGGLWNGAPLTVQNPNTPIGGVTIGAGSFAPAIGFGGANTAVNDAMTVNFGTLPFLYTAPAGYITWTA